MKFLSLISGKSMFEEEGEEQLKKAGELMSEFVNQTAKLEVVKIVRDNIMATEQYWKFRKNMLMSGGILVESTTEVIDTGDIIELRITCRVPPEAAENYAKRRLLFKRLCLSILSMRFPPPAHPTPSSASA